MFLDFSNVEDFSTVSDSILLDKMSSMQLDKNTTQWMKNWLAAQMQRVIVNEAGSHLLVGFHGATL